jgi:hypothetical protein
LPIDSERGICDKCVLISDFVLNSLTIINIKISLRKELIYIYIEREREKERKKKKERKGKERKRKCEVTCAVPASSRATRRMKGFFRDLSVVTWGTCKGMMYPPINKQRTNSLHYHK